eukprot:Awhi_evm1s6281
MDFFFVIKEKFNQGQESDSKCFFDTDEMICFIRNPCDDIEDIEEESEDLQTQGRSLDQPEQVVCNYGISLHSFDDPSVKALAFLNNTKMIEGKLLNRSHTRVDFEILHFRKRSFWTRTSPLIVAFGVFALACLVIVKRNSYVRSIACEKSRDCLDAMFPLTANHTNLSIGKYDDTNMKKDVRKKELNFHHNLTTIAMSPLTANHTNLRRAHSNSNRNASTQCSQL